MPEGEPDRGAAGIAVFSLTLQIPERGIVEDAVNGGPPS